MKLLTRILCLILAAVLLSGCGPAPAPATEPSELFSYLIEETQTPTETIPLEEALDMVPLYFQTDYPDIEYGTGTVATSGCGVTCLAMVATYLTERWYYPDELGYYFGDEGQDNIQRLELGIETMQLPYRKAADWNDVSAVLKEGAVVIALMNENSIFTDSQHFIVLTGLTEEGKIRVLDPFGPNHEIWDLKYGFDNGFTPSQIIAGYSGGWIFFKSDMPQEPFLYQEALPPYIRRGQSRREGESSRIAVVELDPEEKRLLADMLWVLGREESEQCQQALAEVVLNRLASDNYPSSVQEVLKDDIFPSQKELDAAETTRQQMTIVEQAVSGERVLTRDVMTFSKAEAGAETGEGTIGSYQFRRR